MSDGIITNKSQVLLKLHTHGRCECPISSQLYALPTKYAPMLGVSVIVILWSLVYGPCWAPALLLLTVSAGVSWLLCHCWGSGASYLGGKERKNTATSPPPPPPQVSA